MDDGTMSLMVGDKLYRMGLIEPSDYIAVSRWRAESKVSSMLGVQPSNRTLDVTAIKAEACASILCKVCGPFDLLGDIEGVHRLGFVSLIRGGEYKGQPDEPGYEYFKRNLTKTTYQDLERAVFKVSGFKLPAKKTGSDAAPGNPTMPIMPGT